MGDHEDQPTTNPIEEEVDQQEQDIRAGSVRSYECIFCKRGFTTAQALGGHMNIHRKDRAKSSSRPNYLSNNNYSNNNQDQDHSNFYANPSRFYHPIFASYPQSYIPSNPNHYHHHHHQEGNSIHYNISSTSSSTTTRAISHDHQDNVDASEEERMMSSSLQFGWSLGEDKDSRRRILAGDEEDELDLELRLGQI